MPRRSDTYIPNISDLIRKTKKLRRDLVGLVRRFPEGHLDLGERIFVRFLNPVWRKIGGLHGPYEQKQAMAVEWIEQFHQYIRDLDDCISTVMLKPELFQLVPLHRPRDSSATECIRMLVRQEAVLKQIQGALPRSTKSPHSGQSKGDIRAQLNAAIERMGIAYCVSVSRLNRDTIADIAEGRVEKPRTKTREKLGKLFTKIRQLPDSPRHKKPTLKKLPR